MRLSNDISYPHKKEDHEEETRIVEWCRAFGLLGLLTESLIEVWLRQSTGDDLLSATERGYEHHQRGPRGWNSGFWVGSLPTRISRPKGILLQAGKLVEASLGDIAGAYFPSVPKSHRASFRMPTPLSDKFWKMYCEPVNSFVLKAKEFSFAVEAVARLCDDPEVARRGMERLNRLTAHVRPLLVRDRKVRWGQTWVAPSLLSTFAMMAMLDQLKGRRTISCMRCGMVITTSNPTTRYCGDSCRWAGQKRSQRGQPIIGQRNRGRPRKDQLTTPVGKVSQAE